MTQQNQQNQRKSMIKTL